MIEREANSTPVQQGAIVTLGGRRWDLPEGRSLRIGRQSTCDVKIGAADPGPEDLGVSRLAATVSHAQGRVWIRNESTSQPVRIRPDQGGDYVLDRRGDMISLGDLWLEVVLDGQIRRYTVVVEVPASDRAGERADDQPTASPSTQASLPLTPRERHLLTAVCEPLLVSGGSRRPASYREAASRLGLSDHTVRNQLDAMRSRLGDLGIPGMLGPDAKDELARYAVRSGSITPADLDHLDSPSRRP
jgi:hypothetical protein